MEELIRTNDLVLISFVEALMRDANIHTLVADQAVSAVDGSIGIFPRRILVDSDDAEEARKILADAGLGDELRPVQGS
ncbi:DUF2007 domain-containing protein [Chthonobacter albigriseus]|uniref:putative signal transducing protein n=1 Tax=Chthonobacter albigriseus TaxID=1683161 RepID=UPI0015EEE612|nr:DUF2007 domain-containing protein [Chthonobacter albigriseus]